MVGYTRISLFIRNGHRDSTSTRGFSAFPVSYAFFFFLSRGIGSSRTWIACSPNFEFEVFVLYFGEGLSLSRSYHGFCASWRITTRKIANSLSIISSVCDRRHTFFQIAHSRDILIITHRRYTEDAPEIPGSKVHHRLSFRRCFSSLPSRCITDFLQVTSVIDHTVDYSQLWLFALALLVTALPVIKLSKQSRHLRQWRSIAHRPLIRHALD